MKQRLLIAENWHVVAESLRAFLIARGFDVSIANDGLECIALVRDFRPDALIVDADLPWGGGDGVSAWLRDEMLSPLPVVMMTSDGCHASREFDDGHVQYLQRPFRSTELLRAVDAAIQSGRASGFAGDSRAPDKSDARRPPSMDLFTASLSVAEAELVVADAVLGLSAFALP
jgi:DNA-binding response OmpR family regulator